MEGHTAKEEGEGGQSGHVANAGSHVAREGEGNKARVELGTTGVVAEEAIAAATSVKREKQQQHTQSEM